MGYNQSTFSENSFCENLIHFEFIQHIFNEKQPVIVSAVNLAKHIKLRSQSIQALAGILTFSDKVIDKAYKERIKEEMQMTQIGQMLIDEGIEKGIEKATEKLIRTMLLKNKTVEDIHNDTDIPVEVIIRIKESGIKG